MNRKDGAGGYATSAGCGDGGPFTPSDIAKIKRSYVFVRIAVAAFVIGAASPALFWIYGSVTAIVQDYTDALSSSAGGPVAFFLLSLLVFLPLAGALFAASRRGVGVAKKKSGIRKERAASARYLEKVADAHGFSLPRSGAKRAVAALTCVYAAMTLLVFAAGIAACFANAGSETRQAEQMNLAVETFAEAGLDTDVIDIFGLVEGYLTQDSETGGSAIEVWFDDCRIESVDYSYTLDQTKTPEENLALAQQDIESLAELLRKSGVAAKDESIFATPEISEEAKQGIIAGTSMTTLKVSCHDGKTDSNLVTSYSGGETEFDPIEIRISRPLL